MRAPHLLESRSTHRIPPLVSETQVSPFTVPTEQIHWNGKEFNLFTFQYGSVVVLFFLHGLGAEMTSVSVNISEMFW